MLAYRGYYIVTQVEGYYTVRGTPTGDVMKTFSTVAEARRWIDGQIEQALSFARARGYSP